VKGGSVRCLRDVPWFRLSRATRLQPNSACIVVPPLAPRHRQLDWYACPYVRGWVVGHKMLRSKWSSLLAVLRLRRSPLVLDELLGLGRLRE